MQQRRLDRSGLFVSEVGIDCNNFGGRIDGDPARAVVDAALEAGVNFFDTADVYGGQRSEVLLGEALGSRRQDVVIATKVAMPTAPTLQDKGGSRRYVRRAVQASLKRLGTDYIDLYQMHQPDPATPLDETLSVLDDLVRERSVRHEVLPACERFGPGMLPDFPLASGLLTGKYRRDAEPPAGTRPALAEGLARRTMTERNFDRVEALDAFARERGYGLLALAFGWLLAQPVITRVIAGATTPGQVADNAAAARAWRLDEEELGTVAGILAEA